MSNYFHAIYGQGGAPAPEPVDLSPVLLWTNPNPGATFAEQTVSLDLTEYAGVIIEFNRAMASDAQWLANRSYIKKDETRMGAGNLESTNMAARNMTCNNSGVTFEGGYTSTGVNNEAIIPIKIYGVKEYVVEPVGTQMKISASSNNGTENYGQLNIENCKFNKLKIISYENIGNSFTDYPKITVGEAIYKRPSVGTVIDVLNKNVEIASLASVSGYAATGILVEFL